MKQSTSELLLGLHFASWQFNGKSWKLHPASWVEGGGLFSFFASLSPIVFLWMFGLIILIVTPFFIMTRSLMSIVGPGIPTPLKLLLRSEILARGVAYISYPN